MILIIILIIMAIIIIGIEISIKYFKRKDSIIDVEKFINERIKEYGLQTKLVLATEDIHIFDIDENEIYISQGNNLHSLSEGIHELGHAIDFKSKFNVFIQNLLCFTKPLMFISFIICFMHQIFDNKTIWMLSIFVSTISLILVSLTVKDEIVANKYAFYITNRSFNKNISKKIKICLINALSTYIMGWIIIVCVLVLSITEPNYPIF